MLFCRTCRRFNSTSLNPAVDALTEVAIPSKRKYELDSLVEKDLENERIKPRHHPGVIASKTINIPQPFIKAAKIILDDQATVPKKELYERTLNFTKHLKGKKPPMEDDELKDRITVLKNKVISKLEKKNPSLLSDEKAVKGQMTHLLKRTVYNWYSVKYDYIQSLCYLLGRSAPDYAVLMKIFSEIKSRDPDMVPRTLFDFGSGVGTATWAVNSTWPNAFTEYFNVDSSSEMNELAELLLKGGRGERKNPLRGVYYRQFFPSKPVPFDLVVSAYTLMELPSLKSRIDAVRNMWGKTTRYLIVVEQGTRAGFEVINEVRDFILSLGNSHVFSPCPHDNPCPKFMANDGKPCNFAVRYYNLPFIDNHQSIKIENFSYVVLKKGPKTSNDSQWPRLINPSLVRHKHVVCNLCTSEGKIEQSVFTASKNGKLAYRCAKASNWGDRLPMNIKESCDIEKNTGSNDESNQ